MRGSLSLRKSFRCNPHSQSCMLSATTCCQGAGKGANLRNAASQTRRSGFAQMPTDQSRAHQFSDLNGDVDALVSNVRVLIPSVTSLPTYLPSCHRLFNQSKKPPLWRAGFFCSNTERACSCRTCRKRERDSRKNNCSFMQALTSSRCS